MKFSDKVNIIKKEQPKKYSEYGIKKEGTSLDSVHYEKSQHSSKSELDKNLTQMAIPTIYYILKRFSSANKPLSVAEIVEKAQELMKGEDASICDYVLTVDIVKAKLNILADLRVSDGTAVLKPQNENAARFKNAMCIAFGGSIIEISIGGNTTRRKKAHCTYYFKPLLEDADLHMICGAIASNQFFSDAEKSYLISNEEAFHGKPIFPITNTRNSAEQLSLPEKPESCQNHTKDVRPKRTTKDLLQIVSLLYYAISNGYQVKISSARYDVDERTQRITFHPSNNGKHYYLSPYATLWNNGQLYLLATFTYAPEQPRHYRIDRIFDIQLAYKKDSDGNLTNEPHPSAPLPAILQSYRLQSNNQILKHPGKYGKAVIDTAKYVASHPLMSVFNHDIEMLPACILECTNKTLPIIIDTFGSAVTVKPSSIEHSTEKTDHYGAPITYYMVTIRNVHPECMALYCVQQATALSVLWPESLKQSVLDTLKSGTDKLSALPELHEYD